MAEVEASLPRRPPTLPTRCLPLVWGAGVLAWGGRRLYPPGLWQGRSDRRQIALTFDDGPCPEQTPALLNALADEGVPAAFFVIGRRAEAHPDLVRRMHAEGHEVGNHTWNHRPFRLGAHHNLDGELARTEDLLARLCPGSPRYFRPPAGVLGPGDGSAIARHRLVPIYWSLVIGDWDALPPRTAAQRMLDLVHPGAVAALHAGPGQTAALTDLRRMVRDLRAAGYEFVPIAALLREAGVAWETRGGGAA